MNPTLPGSIPGLLRICSPTDRGVVGHIEGDLAWVIEGRERMRDYPLRLLSLRLEDPTGRAHAAWWTAERVGLGEQASFFANDWRGGESSWWLTTPEGGCMIFLSSEDAVDEELGGLSEDVVVPSLSGLTGGDTTEALRRVVLHVAGMEEP